MLEQIKDITDIINSIAITTTSIIGTVYLIKTYKRQNKKKATNGTRKPSTSKNKRKKRRR